MAPSRRVTDSWGRATPVPAATTLGRGRVVACLDGSELAERTLGPAKAWARCLGRPLWLAQVAPSGVPVERRSGGDVTEAGHLAGQHPLHGRLGGQRHERGR